MITFHYKDNTQPGTLRIRWFMGMLIVCFGTFLYVSPCFATTGPGGRIIMRGTGSVPSSPTSGGGPGGRIIVR